MAKKKGTNSKEEETAVLEYLTKSNRPYSANDIYNNLHAKYTKGVIVKVLEKLTADTSIISKTYGKTVIYSVKQNLDMPSANEIEEIEKTTTTLSEKHEELLNENKKLEQVLVAITSEPTTVDTKSLIEELKTKNNSIQERLDKLNNGTVLIPPEKRKRTDFEYENNRILWKKRRGMFRDIFRTVTEHYPGNPNELKEELGIEDDPIPFESDPVEQQ